VKLTTSIQCLDKEVMELYRHSNHTPSGHARTTVFPADRNGGTTKVLVIPIGVAETCEQNAEV
jgi:hypothetical protein